MSALTDILDSLFGIVQDSLPNQNYTAVIGPNVPEGGVSIVQSGGGLPEKHLDCNMLARTQIILTAKHKNQKTALDLAYNAHKALTKTFDFPSENGWQIVDISTITYPSLSEIEAEGAYLITSVLEVTYYWRED